jgi:hypothetical protein
MILHLSCTARTDKWMEYRPYWPFLIDTRSQSERKTTRSLWYSTGEGPWPLSAKDTAGIMRTSPLWSPEIFDLQFILDSLFQHDVKAIVRLFKPSLAGEAANSHGRPIVRAPCSSSQNQDFVLVFSYSLVAPLSYSDQLPLAPHDSFIVCFVDYGTPVSGSIVEQQSSLSTSSLLQVAPVCHRHVQCTIYSSRLPTSSHIFCVLPSRWRARA